MKNSKSLLIVVILLVPFYCFTQDAEKYVRVKFENTANYTFTVLTPSSINFDPHTSRWLEVKIGQEIMFRKMLKKKHLFIITANMQNTIIDVSSTAKKRNKGDTDEIVYLRPPVEKMVESDIDYNLVVEVADVMPSFKLGPEILEQYINENLNYPDEAKEDKISGIVVVDMVVRTDGSITDAKLACDIGGGCGEEALRFIKEMPNWNSGLIADRPIAVNILFPLKFGSKISDTPQKVLRKGSGSGSEYWRMTTHSYIKDFVGTHKKIAVLPASAKVIDIKVIKKNRKTPEQIREKENELSRNIQLAFYEKMQKLKKKNKLNTEVQDIGVTNKILIDSDLYSKADLSNLSPAEVAEVLGVDAVFYPEIRLVEAISKGATALVGFLAGNEVQQTHDAETSDLRVKLYDGCSGMPIWNYHQKVGNNSLVWKTEKLIESMFKREMDKKFPYHLKYSSGS